MALRLIMLWLVLTAICSAVAWAFARVSRARLRLRIALSAALFVACAASYWMYGASLDKTFESVATYFLLWGAIYVAAAGCAGIALGTLAALVLP